MADEQDDSEVDEQPKDEVVDGSESASGSPSLSPGEMTRGIWSLFLWNQVLVIASLFLAMFGVSILLHQATVTTVAISLFMLLLSIGLLITSADFFVEGAKGLARKIGVAEIIIGLTIVSLGTSLPEILISTQAAWETSQNPCIAGATNCASDFALGNIFGSVLVQITLILGLVVLIRPLSVRPSWIGRDGLMMLFAVVLLSVFLLLDDHLSRIEGFILCALYLCYIGYLVSHREQIRTDEFEVIEEIRIEQERTLDWTVASYVVMLAVGLALAMFASERVIDTAAIIAIEFGVPSAVVGTTISAVGTSIPELAVALMAARRSQGVAIGTLIGSNITDPMLSVGLAAMINPISVVSTGLFYGLIMPATIGCVSLCLLFMWTDFKFNRWEGGILVGCYAVFVYLLLTTAG